MKELPPAPVIDGTKITGLLAWDMPFDEFVINGSEYRTINGKEYVVQQDGQRQYVYDLLWPTAQMILDKSNSNIEISFMNRSGDVQYSISPHEDWPQTQINLCFSYITTDRLVMYELFYDIQQELKYFGVNVDSDQGYKYFGGDIHRTVDVREDGSTIYNYYILFKTIIIDDQRYTYQGEYDINYPFNRDSRQDYVWLEWSLGMLNYQREKNGVTYAAKANASDYIRNLRYGTWVDEQGNVCDVTEYLTDLPFEFVGPEGENVSTNIHILIPEKK